MLRNVLNKEFIGTALITVCLMLGFILLYGTSEYVSKVPVGQEETFDLWMMKVVLPGLWLTVVLGFAVGVGILKSSDT